jgi:hypothetical protein
LSLYSWPPLHCGINAPPTESGLVLAIHNILY